MSNTKIDVRLRRTGRGTLYTKDSFGGRGIVEENEYYVSLFYIDPNREVSSSGWIWNTFTLDDAMKHFERDCHNVGIRMGEDGKAYYDPALDGTLSPEEKARAIRRHATLPKRREARREQLLATARLSCYEAIVDAIGTEEDVVDRVRALMEENSVLRGDNASLRAKVEQVENDLGFVRAQSVQIEGSYVLARTERDELRKEVKPLRLQNEALLKQSALMQSLYKKIDKALGNAYTALWFSILFHILQVIFYLYIMIVRS